MTMKIKILDKKIAHFENFDGSFLAILGFEKVVFWTFSKLLWSCLRSVWASFSVLKGQLFVVFSTIIDQQMNPKI